MASKYMLGGKIFPTNWAILVNDEVRSKVGVWLDKIRDYGYATCKNYKHCKYYTYSPDSGESYINDDIPVGYTEITLEDWENHYKKSFPKYWYTENQPEIVEHIRKINNTKYYSKYLGYTGEVNFFHKYKGFNGCNAKPTLGNNTGWNRKEMTYVTFEEWKAEFMKDEFVLPKEWYLKLTPISIDYINQHRSVSIIKGREGYITSDLISNDSKFWRFTRGPLGTEISLKHFKEYVIGDKSTPTQESKVNNSYELF